MSKRVVVGDSQYLKAVDYGRFGTFPQDALDAVVGDAIGYPAHWQAFTVARRSAQEVTVSPGRYMERDTVFEAEDTITINLTRHLPLAASDERFVALVLRGIDEEIREERAFETSRDPETSQPVADETPVVRKRAVSVVVQLGSPAPAPAPMPEIAETDSCLAFVRLTTQGVQEITPGERWRVKTLHEVEGRVTALELQMVAAIQRTTTLETDLANLQARFNDVPRHETVFQLQRDVSRVRRLLDLPDEARGYFYDPGLVKDQWDLEHGQWLARIDEGIRLPWASERDARLELLNPAQPGIRVTDEVLLPAWQEENIVTVEGTGSTKSISQEVHTVTTAHQRTVARSSVHYGPTVAMCDNVQEWSQIGKVREGQQFQVNGETFQKVNLNGNIAGIDTSTFNQVHNSNYTGSDVVMHNAQRGETGYREIYAARSVQVSHWTETYWDYVTETFGVNGSVYAQTFLLTQPIVITSIELNFDRVAADGAVTLMLCEVDVTGTPIFDNVIARSTLPRAALARGWVKFPFRPRFLKPGRRYAWVTVTTGNHSIRTVTGAKYAQGTLFWSTDQGWFQGSPEEDFHFKLNAARFETTRVVVDFALLTLDLGMTELRLLYEAWAPDGTSMVWEVKPSGRDKWEPLKAETAEAPNPLRGLPASAQIRLVMQGTTRLAPAILLSAYSRAMTRRPRGDARAVTKLLTFGYATKAIRVEVVVDQFDPSINRVVPRIRNGNALIAASSISRSQDLSKSTRQTITALFTVPDLMSARLQIDLETDSVQSAVFVENVSLYAL